MKQEPELHVAPGCYPHYINHPFGGPCSPVILGLSGRPCGSKVQAMEHQDLRFGILHLTVRLHLDIAFNGFYSVYMVIEDVVIYIYIHFIYIRFQLYIFICVLAWGSGQ